MKIIKLFILMAAVVFGLSSCLQEIEPAVLPAENSLDEIDVSPDFRYNTYRTIEVIVSGYTKGLVEVMSSDGVVYQKAYLQKKQPHPMQITIPTYEKFLVIRFKGTSANIEITSDVITWDFI